MARSLVTLRMISIENSYDESIYLNFTSHLWVQVIHKRRIAMQKAQGNISVAIEYLNKYLEMYGKLRFLIFSKLVNYF